MTKKQNTPPTQLSWLHVSASEDILIYQSRRKRTPGPRAKWWLVPAGSMHSQVIGGGYITIKRRRAK